MSTPHQPGLDRRSLLAGAVALPAPGLWPRPLGRRGRSAPMPVLVGSANALAGMQQHYARLVEGADPLDVALEVVQVVERDPEDTSVGLGGLPNEDGVVQLDAACMHGPTHNSGAVAALENILHPSAVARLVMERTDHCLLVGEGAYRFARAHGHEHVDLLTERARRIWLDWKESMSALDDRLPPQASPRGGSKSESGEPLRSEPQAPKELDPEGAGGGAEEGHGSALDQRRAFWRQRQTGTVHCSALSTRGEVACTTTTSGLAWKIPGRVGDSPVVGAGLYCDQEAGSAGATGRGEAAVLANASFAIVELMRQGATPLDAGLEVLRRVARQVERQAAWQPSLLDDAGRPSFGLKLYALGLDGSTAGVTLRGGGRYAVADPERGPRIAELVPLFE